ncbi:aminotransferase class IV [Inediibacterium massiliense]|uniref:aminotransferase class IV n=1 Tax=Inediibacterium massiliense TaxID=1658111 RepID=UPI0006B67B4F|nr:aminotransferase class IV [Inediibacterium massiliense]
MKPEAFLSYYIYNEEVYKTEEIHPFEEISSSMIYEVIRIIDGIPLFLEEHLERLRKSANILNQEVHKSDEEIEKEILQLVLMNDCKNINVKLLCTNLEKEKQDFFTYLIQSYYPEKEVYEKGIHTVLYHSERKNPNAKVLNTSFKERVKELLEKENAFEAILVNEDGSITEGSRSNMFFVKNSKVYTALGKNVLLGVTRNKIMEVCKSLGIEVIEKSINESEIPTLQGAFMSGTSVNVLPIESIGDDHMNSVHDPIIEKIGSGYIEEMNKYLQSKSAK